MFSTDASTWESPAPRGKAELDVKHVGDGFPDHKTLHTLTMSHVAGAGDSTGAGSRRADYNREPTIKKARTHVRTTREKGS